MTIYQRVEAAFRAAGVPGFLQAWRKTDAEPEIPPKFGVYLISRIQPALSADDQELIRRYDVTVHLYGDADLSGERAALEQAFEEAGFLHPQDFGLADVRVGEYQYHTRMDLIYYDYL